jgi:hypothetical protein
LFERLVFIALRTFINLIEVKIFFVYSLRYDCHAELVEASATYIRSFVPQDTEVKTKKLKRKAGLIYPISRELSSSDLIKKVHLQIANGLLL